ncbi:inverse autotransporter beta domain-containing protein [Xenorhabdus sp. SGI240]|uniref:inverse autotransporter beta domain-containing protein n=1 Tax=Xenorhabdus sp. SGI240 TaxID=3158262 RepID=UPI0032B87229
MSSYTRKIIGFFIFFYVLFMPSTIINALAEATVKTDDKLYTHFKKKNDTSDLSSPHIIISNIQKASHILSSSPSELAEQAKSYALGKFNNTLSSETQKWLSQFGTVRINFGLDRKWTLKNNSLDILLPLYDDKADWLFFSQLGYRNKDSRNTMNLGLGGRYFYQNWMYGLNAFYDHDFTGKNQRLGLGGEIWGDYIKLSANTYYRLSDWQKSRTFQDYYERPANGYDINGEFFLPAYPNLGMKLTYEQYFGDKVTLFNRDTKQKNPSLAKFGLTYTPIPLVTMGVDYKQGESGHTETQFLANLNYKFGVPFSIQLSPANVASMRTLASSRYDLVERNNHIVLDHVKREQEILIALEPIVGYGHQEIPINLPVPSNINIKKIRWIVSDKAFLHNKGKLSSDSGKSIVITLPSYQETHKNDYLLDILLEYTIYGQKKTKPIQIPMKVLPFMIEGKVNIIPPESPIATGEKENGYTFGSPIITYAGSPSGKFVKNARIDKVAWTTEPALGTGSGLRFLWNNQPAQTNEKGELTDEKGKLIPNILLSEKPHKKVDIYIQLDGAPQQKIGSVTFSKKQPHYKIKDNKLSVAPDPKKSLVADGTQKYTYTADITIDGGLAADNVDNVKWSAVGKNLAGKEIKDISVEAPTGTVKTNNGKLNATLSSKTPLKDVVVTLSIANKESASAEAVSFVADPKEYRVDRIMIDHQSPLIANGQNTYTYTAYIVDQSGSALPEGQNISNIHWDKNKDTQGLNFTFKNGVDSTGAGGTLTAKLSSVSVVDSVAVSLSVENQQPPILAKPVAFIADTSSYHIDGGLTVDPKGPLTVGDGKFYTFKATVIDRQKNKVINQPIDGVIWQAKDDKGQEVKLTTQKTETNEEGKLIAILDSSVPLNGVKVSLAIEHHAVVTAEAVSIEPENINVLCKATNEQQQPVLVTETYTCTATVTDVAGQGVSDKAVSWQVKDNINLKPTTSSEKTNYAGKITATLTSPIEASNIIVIASVTSADGQSSQGESKDKINFVWPEITMEKEPKDHDVTIGGQEKYLLTARAWREKNKTAYKEPDIKFRWSKPQNQNGTEATDVTLSPLPPSTDSSQSVNPKDGTLQVNVVSSKAQQVKACIDIDGRKPAAPTCSEGMNFVDPPPEFDISSVEVTDFDANNPLQGNGTDEYHYKALIVKKGTTEPLRKYTFNGAQWTHDHDKIKETKFPQPKAYSPEDPTNEETRLKTDDKGYLHAKLKSSVGVENVTVTLTMAEPDGTDVKRDADTQIAFNPVPKPAVLYVYNKNNTAVFKYFNNKGGKDHPHTVFDSLRGELRETENSGSFYDDKEITDIAYHLPPDKTNSIYGIFMLAFGDGSGPIQFNAPGTTEINTKVTMDSGEIKLYKYEININKSSGAIPNYQYVDPSGVNINCQNKNTPQGVIQDLYSDKEAYDPNNPTDFYSLHNEWGGNFDLYDWGIFDHISGRSPDKVTIIVNNTGSDSHSKPFRIYDAKNNTFDKQTEGIIFCYSALTKTIEK